MGVFFAGVVILIIISAAEKITINSPIVDNENIYSNADNSGVVKELYITVMPINGQPENSAFTFSELNELIYEDIKVNVIFQEGINGMSNPGQFGFGLTDANATMELRGQSSRRLDQKSYKINLDKNVGFWEGFQTINLSKHSRDPVKIRNKLSFDLFKGVSNFTSLRTQFVHVFIKDFSQENYSQEYVDYGLFTLIENVDKDFLKNHGLDNKGSLYKAENFEFYRYPGNITFKEDNNYKKSEFEQILEIKGNDDHSKLIAMLDDVNNSYLHINEVIEKYFDRENYLTWLAVNFLVGNIDTSSRNYYLYSPTDSNKWYFLPWDYDGTWGWYEKLGQESYIAPWQSGVSNYWGVVLHQRFLKNDQNRADLVKKVEELSALFTTEKIVTLIDGYKLLITEYLMREPDNEIIKGSEAIMDAEFELIVSSIEANKLKFFQSLEKPMPVFMGSPTNIGDYITFNWTKSYDFQNDQLEYIIEISKTPDFHELVYRAEGIIETEHLVSGLGSGTYYWKLAIRDSEGNVQVPFDTYIDSLRNYYFGVQKFLVN